MFKYIYDMPSLYHETESKTYIDMKMEKISGEEYKKIVLGGKEND
jgi:hypothetical protein